MARISHGGGSKPKTKKQIAAKKLWARFTSEDKRGKETVGRPLANRGKFRKVADALGRDLTAVEERRLKTAGYNAYSHTVSIKKLKSGKLSFSIKKKKNTRGTATATPSR